MLLTGGAVLATIWLWSAGWEAIWDFRAGSVRVQDGNLVMQWYVGEGPAPRWTESGRRWIVGRRLGASWWVELRAAESWSRSWVRPGTDDLFIDAGVIAFTRITSICTFHATLWPFAVAFSVLGLATLRLAERARRRSAGECVRCGYDLRGLEPRDACPECGRSPSACAGRGRAHFF